MNSPLMTQEIGKAKAFAETAGNALGHMAVAAGLAPLAEREELMQELTSRLSEAAGRAYADSVANDKEAAIISDIAAGVGAALKVALKADANV